MGYRSMISVVLDEASLSGMKKIKDLVAPGGPSEGVWNYLEEVDECESMDTDDGNTFYYLKWEWEKWYDCDLAVALFMKTLREQDFWLYIRIGEETGDVDHEEGEGYDYSDPFNLGVATVFTKDDGGTAIKSLYETEKV